MKGTGKDSCSFSTPKTASSELAAYLRHLRQMKCGGGKKSKAGLPAQWEDRNTKGQGGMHSLTTALNGSGQWVGAAVHITYTTASAGSLQA
eukprot:1160312-Pelagomonas_calceolata.AAC.5